ERVVIGIHQRTPPRVADLGLQLQAIYDLPACEKFHKALLINLFQVLPAHERKNAVYQGVDRGVGIEVPDRASASPSQFRLMAWIVPVYHLQRRIEALIGKSIPQRWRKRPGPFISQLLLKTVAHIQNHPFHGIEL